MRVSQRVIVAVGVGAMALFGMGVATNAQPQRDQGRQEDKQQDKDKDKPQDKKRGKSDQSAKRQAPGQQKKEQPQPQARPEPQARPRPEARPEPQARPQPQPQAQARPEPPRARRDPQEQQALIRQHEQRLPQYRDLLDQQQRAAERRAAELEQQKRQAAFAFQREYLARLRDQESRVRQRERYDYDHDPFFFTPSRYRYSRDGHRFETNQYGRNLLQQAVNYGYEEGFHAGQADRQDHWPSNYLDCYAYQDANYGYEGFYVDRDDYNYYFREGFRRGYQDGYGTRPRYGTVSRNKVAILASVLAGILTYELIR